MRLPEVYVKGNNVCHTFTEGILERDTWRKRTTLTGQCCRSNTSVCQTKSSTSLASSKNETKATSEVAGAVSREATTAEGVAAIGGEVAEAAEDVVGEDADNDDHDDGN